MHSSFSTYDAFLFIGCCCYVCCFCRFCNFATLHLSPQRQIIRQQKSDILYFLFQFAWFPDTCLPGKVLNNTYRFVGILHDVMFMYFLCIIYSSMWHILNDFLVAYLCLPLRLKTHFLCFCTTSTIYFVQLAIKCHNNK